MINTNAIYGLMGSKRISGAKVAKNIGITPKTFYMKMKKGIFNTNEIEILIKVLDIKNPSEIFFCKNSNL